MTMSSGSARKDYCLIGKFNDCGSMRDDRITNSHKIGQCCIMEV